MDKQTLSEAISNAKKYAKTLKVYSFQFSNKFQSVIPQRPRIIFGRYERDTNPLPTYAKTMNYPLLHVQAHPGPVLCHELQELPPRRADLQSKDRKQ